MPRRNHIDKYESARVDNATKIEANNSRRAVSGSFITSVPARTMRSNT